MIEPSIKLDVSVLFQQLQLAVARVGKSVRLHGSKWWCYGSGELCFRVGPGVFHVGRHYEDVPALVLGMPSTERASGICIEPRQEPFGRYEIREAGDVNSFVLEALRLARTRENCVDVHGTRTHNRRGHLIYALRYPDHQEPKE